MTGRTIMIVDDDRGFAHSLASMLCALGLPDLRQP